METITIPKKEYKALKEAKARIEAIRESPTRIIEKKKFYDTAFGALKNSFGKETSATYVSRLRKSWRV
jgi:hypothetical protein